jgi:hypothetical protein
LMAGCFGIEGTRGCSGEPEWGEEARRRACYWKGKQLGRAAEGRAGGARPSGGDSFYESGGRRWGEWAWWPRGEKEVRPGTWLFGPTGRLRRGGGGLWLGLGEGGGPREEEGEAGLLKAKTQAAGPKTEMGPSSKRNSFRILN